MKHLIAIIALLSTLSSFAQNGLKEGNLFLLQKDNKTISINGFEQEKIIEKGTLEINSKSIYETDRQHTVAILDTATNHLTIHDIHSQQKSEIPLPYNIEAKCILVNKDNVFIGGIIGREALIQYNIRSKKWYSLDIPVELIFPGKAVDDILIKDSLLIAIDNIVLPKYALFYKLNAAEKYSFSHLTELKSNGAYENIHQGRITDKYFGLLSDTYSGYVGASWYITIYDGLHLKNSFCIGFNEQNKKKTFFNDFVIINDNIIIATKEKGLGVLSIKKSYFKEKDEDGLENFNTRINPSLINYIGYNNKNIIKLTIIPNTNKVVLTIKNRSGGLSHKIVQI
ncbi:hypothetical protein M2451_001144 [Dysgonomonas sp. PFB1-18]|uniref:hypothetical protein n=1 Tax=unclassified Dysgonomonas TaxID=2630389 RepID=UPI0024745EDA|nr:MULTISPECIES: hypothetical protein [unclassified Dysgonomonas]MDH6308231.1 hypothetical protein [Dysgonomonas sp. PF1-14]MDH6338330.1 hypothetical protein [Dysgonomonas sp. PF1-16]MDH6379827.1 hypothetical protein [Dysgonomonas sp. PFB1-18]MDH6397083.1 hypothetical protein [Dysgonomonas sp. PF1-23]